MIAHRMMSRTALLDVGIAEPIKTGENRKCCQIFFSESESSCLKTPLYKFSASAGYWHTFKLGACALAPFWPIEISLSNRSYACSRFFQLFENYFVFKNIFDAVRFGL